MQVCPRGREARLRAVGVVALDPHASTPAVDLAAVVERAPLGLGMIAPDGRFTFVNPALAGVLGHPQEQVLRAEAVSFLHDEDRAAGQATLTELLVGTREDSRTELRYVRVDGTVVLARIVTAAVRGASGAIEGVVVTIEDVTAERQAAQAQAELASLIAVLDEAVLTMDGTGRVRSWNSAAQRLLGWSAEEAIGQPVSMAVPADRQAEQRAWLAQLANGETVRAETVRLHRDGSRLEVAVTITPVLGDDGTPVLAIGVMYDIGARKLALERLEHLARHDPVTGLANRHEFTERLHAAVQRSARTGDPVGLLFIDLDRFKDVNDRYGHPVGDQYLRLVGARLLGVVRPTDVLARWGGDEYAVLLEHAEGRGELAAVADRLLAALARPIHIDSLELPVAASVGVAVSDRGVAAEDLLRAADGAMYAAKSSGGSRSAAAWQLPDH
jgi:diguanylate cyclase (GGDEF)-like protein/PAS domain S-box-containing protein